MEPTAVLRTYWWLAAERHAMYCRRISGVRGPWTTDPILRQYRFTNSYRVNDRVSQYLIREVQYHPDRSNEAPDLFYRILLFKMFNSIDTWEYLEAKLGPINWSSANLNDLNDALSERKARGERLYSPAYIMPAPKLGHAHKHTNHLQLLVRMMEDGLPKKIQTSGSLRSVYELLKEYPGIGKFLAFQFTIDLNYSELLSYHESDFVVAGPGAIDGIAKCFLDSGRRSPEDVIYEVFEHQVASFAEEGIESPTLRGRRLQPVDCQNLFCEVSKYARVAHPEVEGLFGRNRIKQKYRQNVRPLPRPKYPPRWNLDEPWDETHTPAAHQESELSG